MRADNGPLDLATFTDLIGRLCEDIPPALLAGLNGGIIVLPETKRAERPDLYVLGEYLVEEPGLGRLIVIYHGSFRRIMGSARIASWEREARATIAHELRHHIEALAGVRDLEREDEERLAEFLRPGDR